MEEELKKTALVSGYIVTEYTTWAQHSEALEMMSLVESHMSVHKLK